MNLFIHRASPLPSAAWSPSIRKPVGAVPVTTTLAKAKKDAKREGSKTIFAPAT